MLYIQIISADPLVGSQQNKLANKKKPDVGNSTTKPLSRVKAAARTPKGINRAAACR